MKITITDTEINGTAELSIIDPKSNCDWTADLLGNHGALPDYNDETDSYHMTQDDYNWWSDLIERYQAADDRYHELLHDLSNDNYEAIREAAQNISCDLENYPEALQDVCDEYDTDN